ncbi:Rhodanese-related sulfurtransferase [Lampropedia hyalina DSM 16112]|jgi:rhodanese-related sulfurtransferase|uniref:Rhodanese-related sulfurtransferase n=1 Tax=Lampropedia hyalina DSM 16112 TaxID=1122156 RepID=A0A1M4V7H3_9BURK|nr:rhodanese-like domain-containing protein [Lampropedia hyalina]SHE64941.1 Rhodanese-related sulfurtransferase [Lampropedia hyalina DSM 16112]
MIEHIHPSQFAAWVQQHQQHPEQPLLIDVREPWEWQVSSLPADVLDGCEFRQLSMGQIPSELDRLDPDRPTAILCHHGVRSHSVALYLQENGFEQLANIAGGIDAWAQVQPGIPGY